MNKKKEAKWLLQARQKLPLDDKINMSGRRIIEFYKHFEGDVYVAFSGGKDSTALLHLARQIYPDIPAKFVDTGLEFPEVREFVKTIDNVEWIKPKYSFKKIIEAWGYPVISKTVSDKIYRLRNTESKWERRKILDGIMKSGKESPLSKLPKTWRFLTKAPFMISAKCCYHLKKAPLLKYKNYITGMMAYDSQVREQGYLRYGCNVYEGNARSAPLAFWTEEDIWQYLKEFNVPYSKIYDMGYTNTGCMFCMFGIHYDVPPNRFQTMKKTHPKLHKYCMEKLGLREVLEFIGEPWE